MNVLFGYQDVFEVIKNGVTPLFQNATEAQQATHKEEKKRRKGITKRCSGFINVLMATTLRKLVIAIRRSKLEY